MPTSCLSKCREPDRQPEARQAALGACKIRELLVRRLNGDVRVPATSTIHAVLDRHGLVRRMSRRRNRATGTPLSQGVASNDLWCADRAFDLFALRALIKRFKGRLG
jgi:hypothetical protein